YKSVYLHHTTTTQIYTLSLHDALPISEKEQVIMATTTATTDGKTGTGTGTTTDTKRHSSTILYQQISRNGSTTGPITAFNNGSRSEEHTSELQSRENLVCRLLLEKKKK